MSTETTDLPHGERPVSPEELTRRQFLTKVGIALAGLTGALVTTPLIGFLIAPLFRKPPEIWRAIGPVSDYKVGDTVQISFLEASPLPWAGVTARTAVECATR